MVERSANVLSTAVVVLSSAVGVWCIAYPAPLRLALAANAAFPLMLSLAIACSKGALGFAQDARLLNPMGSLVFPACALALHAAARVQLVNWLAPPLVSACLALTFFLIVVSIAVEPPLRRNWSSIAGLTVLLLGHSYPSTVLANMLLDKSRPSALDVRVAGKDISRIKAGRLYYLEVSPLGSKTVPLRHRVSRAFFEQAAVGDTALAVVHEGAFGAAWVQLEPSRE